MSLYKVEKILENVQNKKSKKSDLWSDLKELLGDNFNSFKKARDLDYKFIKVEKLKNIIIEVINEKKAEEKVDIVENKNINSTLLNRWNDVFTDEEIIATRRILSPDEIEVVIQDLIKKDFDEYIEFMNNPQNNKFYDIIARINPMYQDFIFGNIKLYDNFYLLIQVGKQIFTINNNNLPNIVKILEKETMITKEEEFVTNTNPSDAIIAEFIILGKKMRFIWKEIKRTRPNGGFFKYYSNLEKFDFSRYGIYHNNSETDNYELNCLEIAILNSPYDEIKNKLSKIKTMIQTRYIPRKDLKIIADELEIYITVKSVNDQNKSRVENYGNKEHVQLNLGLLDDHYFIIEKTEFTSFSIDNYFKGVLHEQNEPNYISGVRNGKFRRDKAKVIDSFKLIQLLIENKNTHLTKIDLTNCGSNTIYVKNIDYGNNLEYNYKDIRNCEDKPMQKPAIFNKQKKTDHDNDKYYEFGYLYFDTESTTDGEIHKPYMICSEDRGENSDKKCFIGDFCILNWLKSLKNNYVCFAHNLRYDFQFIIKYLYDVKDLIMSGTRIKTVSGLFFNSDTNTTIRLCFKDTYGIISSPLSGFQKMFKIESKKEIMPYNLYNTETINLKSVKISDAKFENSNDFADFVKNIDEWNLRINNNEFNHIEYAKKYCEMDVTVLKKGYEIFRQWMLNVSRDFLVNDEIDIDYCVSIPQFAFIFGKKYGVFNGTKELSMIPRDFIQRCVVGGRCMIRNNKKEIVKHAINDFDGVSLYPSAMARLPGVLIGYPKKWHKDIDLSKVDGYFLEINVKDIKKKYPFPLISRKNEKGIREFSNDIRGNNIYVDKVGLEDLIEFHNIDYEIIRGYYFNEGRNNKINSFITRLFNERLIKKQQGNPIEVVYKLIMNAFYGKTIMKPVDSDYKIVCGNDNEIDNYVSFNFNKIVYYTKISDRMSIFKNTKPINKHFSMPQIGTEILSMSKRIMNEVMCLAHDNNIEIYYQDTDSMHIDFRKNSEGKTGVDILREEFMKKYNRELVGEDLGQFHNDFSLGKAKNVYSKGAVFLGKKSYCDHLVGELDGKIVEGAHIRMKGIPNKIMDKEIKNHEGGVIGYYTDLYNNKHKNINIVSSCKFKTNKDFTTSSHTEFYREIFFPDNEEILKARQLQRKQEKNESFQKLY